MARQGLILTGTRGAGKTTLAEELARSHGFTAIGAVTTRHPRSDDRPGAYTYLADSEFAVLSERGALLVESSYGQYRYGIETAAVAGSVANGATPLLTVTPEAATRLVTDTAGPVSWSGIFVDAPDTILNARLSADGRSSMVSDLEQRTHDRSFCVAPLIPFKNVSPPLKSVSEVLSLWAALATGA